MSVPRMLAVAVVLMACMSAYALDPPDLESPLSLADVDVERLDDVLETIRANTERGVRLHRDGSYQQAIDELVKNQEFADIIELADAEPYYFDFVRDDPGYFAYYDSVYYTGLALLALERYEEAAAWFGVVISVFPTWQPAYSSLASTRMRQDRSADAIGVWGSYVDYYDANYHPAALPAAPLQRLADLAISVADYAAAIEAGRRAMTIADPARAGVLLTGAYAALETGDGAHALVTAACAAPLLSSGVLSSWELPAHHWRFQEAAEENTALAGAARFILWMLAVETGTAEEQAELEPGLAQALPAAVLTTADTAAEPMLAYYRALLLARSRDLVGALDLIAKAAGGSPAVAGSIIADVSDFAPLVEADLHGEAWASDESPIDYARLEAESELRMVVQSGHALEVNDIAVSPDERIIATVSAESLNLWTTSGVLLRSFGAGDRGLWRVAFSANGRYVAAGDQGSDITVWSLDGSRRWSSDVAGYPVEAIAFSPDSAFVATGLGARGSQAMYPVRIYTIDGRLYRELHGITQPVNAVAFSSDSARVATTSSDGVVRIWDIVRGLPVSEFAVGDEHGTPLAARFASDDRELLVHAAQRILRIDLSTGAVVPLCHPLEETNLVVFGTDGGAQQVTLPTDAHRQSWLSEQAVHHDYRSYGRDWSVSTQTREYHAPATRIATGPNVTVVLDAAGVVHVHQRGATVPIEFAARGSWIVDAALSPDGAAIAANYDHGVTVIQRLDGYLELEIPIATLQRLDSIEFSPDGERLLIVSDTPNTRGSDGRHTDELAAFSEYDRDGRLLRGSTFRFGSGAHVGTHEGGRGPTYSASYDTDGRTIRMPSVGLIHPDESITSLPEDGDAQTVAAGALGPIIEEASVHATSDDGSLVAVATNPYFGASATVPVRIYRADGREAQRLESDLGAPRGLFFTPDARYLIAYGHRTDWVVWNMDSGHQLHCYSRDGQWIAFTPDGYYTSSNDGGDLVAMVKGLTPYRIDQFAPQRNRPDIIYRRMAMRTAKAIDHYARLHQIRAFRLGIDPDRLGATHVPTAEITSTSIEQRTAVISFTLRDNRYDLASYNVYVNGVPVHGSYGVPVTGHLYSARVTLELTGGISRIEVSCTNAQGAESYRAATMMTAGPELRGDLYYVGLGVSDYQDDRLDLGYAAKDVTDLANALSTMAGSIYGEIHILALTDEEVTRGALDDAQAFLSRSSVEDTVVLLVAGHGLHDSTSQATYYYLTHDADLRALDQTCIAMSDIDELIQTIPARSRLILLDTCSSGELLPEALDEHQAIAVAPSLAARGLSIVSSADETTPTTTILPRRGYLLERDRYIYNDLVRRSGAVVLSSSRGNELSYEDSALENGVFTEAVLLALTTAAADTDSSRVVDREELERFVHATVSEATGRLQNPTVDRDNIYAEIRFPIEEVVP